MINIVHKSTTEFLKYINDRIKIKSQEMSNINDNYAYVYVNNEKNVGYNDKINKK